MIEPLVRAGAARFLLHRQCGVGESAGLWSESSGAAGKAFNLATGTRVTLNHTYQALQKIIGFTKPAKYRQERAGDIKHSLADVTLAEKHLGYRTRVKFEDGLVRTVDWYREQVAHTEPVPASSPK